MIGDLVIASKGERVDVLGKDVVITRLVCEGCGGSVSLSVSKEMGSDLMVAQMQALHVSNCEGATGPQEARA